MAAIEVVGIQPEEALKLLSQQEGHFLDFKSKAVAPGKLSRSVSAFANADGGEIFVGMEDHGGTFEWDGFEQPEDANGTFQMLETVFPLGPALDARFLRAEGRPGLVLQLEIKKIKDIVATTSGEIYVRRSAQNLPVKSDESLQRLRLDKGLESFETRTVNADPEVITNSEAIIGFVLEIVPHQEPEPWLRKQQLIAGALPTVAGTVLFADEPQAILPKRCGIKIYRYKTTEEEGTREALTGQPVTVEGNAYSQIYEAVAKTKALIEGIKRMTPEGLVSVEYPEETLHEIITNAVLHRDYSIADDVHIRVYDNRIEVESPGVLPGHVTTENILDTRFARNGNIVRIINKFPDPPNKDVGEGLNTAFKAMEKLQLKKPVIQQKPESVLVAIRHERLASPEDSIMEYLETRPTISNGQARELCVIREDWRIRSIFGRMVDAGMIEKVPGSTTSNTAYRKG
jgi:ATP-dependent DNA helicase RecG